MKELGERLRILRESVKLSQVKMADLLGVKQSSINRYEQGQSAPSLETLVIILMCLWITCLPGRISPKASCTNTALKLQRAVRKCGSLLKCVLTRNRQ